MLHEPCPININADEVAMSPTILELAKKDITGLWIEATFAIGFPFPEVCKPSVPGVKIQPTLYMTIETAHYKMISNERNIPIDTLLHEEIYLAMHGIVPPWSLEHIPVAEVECTKTWSFSISPHAIVYASVPKKQTTL